MIGSLARAARAAAGGLLLATIVVGVEATPASASVTATASGTIVTVNVTGDGSVGFGCSSGSFTVNLATTTPAISCAAVTRVNVNGDGGAQTVNGSQLDDPNMTAHPFLSAVLNAGNDTVFESAQADLVNLGADDDTFVLFTGGVTNTGANLGTGSNNVTVYGAATLANTITIGETGSTATFAISNGGGSLTQSVSGVQTIYAYGGLKDDVIDASGVAAASAASYMVLEGNQGHNTITSIHKPATFFSTGGSGATFTGGPGIDQFWSSSSADVIHTGGGDDTIYDIDSPASGGRTVEGSTTYRYYSQLDRGDVVSRVRPLAGGGAQLTNSLRRSGIQQFPAGTLTIAPNFNYYGEKDDLGLADVVIPAAQTVAVNGDDFGNDLLDITVPSGTWTQSGTPASGSVATDDPNLGNVTYTKLGTVLVHAPWPNASESFVHRVTRDLVFRFPTAGQRTALAAALAAGTKTRAQVVHDLVFSDEYRGLDVERIFRQFLKRSADPGGRTYWIKAIRDGRSLRKFRAQLFGGSEYYTKAGSTPTGFVNAAYRDVLGRSPDPSGLAHWVNKINTGTARGSVANSFLGSTEFRRTTTKVQFLRFLDRLPSTAEVDRWMTPLATSATGEQDLVAFLAGSNSYNART